MKLHRVDRFLRRGLASISFLLLLSVFTLPGQEAALGQEMISKEILKAEHYVTPPQEIAEAVLAPRYLNVSLTNISRNRRWFLSEVGDGPVPMARFSTPFDELGGQFLEPGANRTRRLTTHSNAGIKIISAADGSTVDVQIPRGARISNATWSPDGSQLAFLAHFDDATHLFVADPGSGRSRQLTNRPVLATLYTSFDWSDDGSRIATVLLPDDRPSRPAKPVVPQGPQVKMTEKGENLLRTYASLMVTPYELELLKWHASGQVALIDVERRRAREVGDPAMIRSLDVSPDGQYIRVTRVVEPFSYIVPVNNFGTTQEIWDVDGNVLTTLEEDSLNTGIRDDDQPQGGQFGQGQQTGRRELAWRPDGQGLTYLEQEPAPEGEDTAQAEEEEEDEPGERQSRRKDRVMQWLPPFDSASISVVYESDTRMSSHRFSPDMQILFASERTGQNTHQYAVFLAEPDEKHTLVRYKNDDFYANPGSLLTTTGTVSGGGRFGRGGGGGGSATIQLSADGEHVYFAGTQYDENPEEVGPKTFIDRVAIRTDDKERIYESDNNGVYERVTAVLDIDAQRFVVSKESPTQVPQGYLMEGGSLTQLTQNQDYTPDLTSAPRERIRVTRADGFEFWVDVMLPSGYRAGTSFQNFGTRSMHYLTRLGYAVVEPDAPIIGDEGAMNNNYEHDLRNNLSAVIDELDRRDLVDRTRLGLGGHSYGSFSTANAMVHTPFFKAGIAGDGNFNRTFTPLSFQSERRLLWDAKEVYLNMSAFLFADQLTGALLIYHGLHDQNVGTDPNHAPRMFHALNGLNKTAAMYLYPFEDHGPASRETLLDLWARWTAWLDVYLMNPDEGEEEEG
jgi:dipeptidyl aminopeptidase/acylaminoacyl peptidase